MSLISQLIISPHLPTGGIITLRRSQSSISPFFLTRWKPGGNNPLTVVAPSSPSPRLLCTVSLATTTSHLEKPSWLLTLPLHSSYCHSPLLPLPTNRHHLRVPLKSSPWLPAASKSKAKILGMVVKIPADPSGPIFHPLSCYVLLFLATPEDLPFLDTPCPSLPQTFAHAVLNF